MKLLSHVFALLQPHTLMPTEDVLLAMHLTIGTLIVKLASHALEIPTGMLQLANASAALKDSLSITAN